MRTLHFILLYLLTTITLASAQSDRSNRNSLSLIHLDYNDNYSRAIDRLFADIRPDARYDLNEIPTKRILVNGKRTWQDKSGNYEAPERTKQIEEYLNEKNVGNEIISYLFNRNSRTGIMDLARLHQRGEYDATDDNILESKSTKRGLEAIKENGFELIDNCYVLIYDFSNIRYEYKKEDSGGDYYWFATPAAYLFKIEWSDNLQNELFDCWIGTDTDAREAIVRRKTFNHLSVPLRFVIKATDNNLSECSGIEEQQRKINNGGKREHSNDELKTEAFNKLIYMGADKLGEQIEGKHQPFHIANALYATSPLRAKIGTKESVKVNDRYFVYEHRQTSDGNMQRSRKGVVRATTHIAQNQQMSSGNSASTEFYQIAGGKLEEGMSMEEKHSLYLNLDLGYRLGKLEGVYAGLSSNLYATRATNHNAMIGATVWKEAVTVTLDYGFGLRCNNFDIYPYVGIGVDTFLKEEEENSTPDNSDKNYGWLAQGGLRFDINLYYPVQLFGAVEYNYLWSKGEGYAAKMISKDRDINGVNAYGGIRICF